MARLDGGPTNNLAGCNSVVNTAADGEGPSLADCASGSSMRAGNGSSGGVMLRNDKNKTLSKCNGASANGVKHKSYLSVRSTYQPDAKGHVLK